MNTDKSISELKRITRINSLINLIYNSDSNNLQLKLNAILYLQDLMLTATVAEYRAACVQATKLAWKAGTLESMAAIIMLPTTLLQNSVYFTSNGNVTVIADQPSIAGVSGFQASPPAPNPESAAFSTVYENGSVAIVSLTPSNTPLKAGNDRIQTNDNGTLCVSKTVTTYPIGLYMLASDIGNSYINECLFTR